MNPPMTDFEFGFRSASDSFQAGHTVEEHLNASRLTQTDEYLAGAMAWGDLFLGWTDSKLARRAKALGLDILEYRAPNGGIRYMVP